MSELNSLTKTLVTRYQQIASDTGGDTSAKIEVSQTVSLLGSIYEKMRNAVEYRETHLLRKAAIERILRRRILLNQPPENFTESLVKELLWGKYLKSGSISENTVDSITQSIKKYLDLRRKVIGQLDNSEQIRDVSDWIIEVLSCKIEFMLVPNLKSEVFTNYFYRQLEPNIKIKDNKGLSDNALVYLSTQEAFNKADKALLRYHFVLLYGEETLFKNFWKVYKTTNDHLESPARPKLTNHIKKQVPPFLILESLFNKTKTGKLETLLENKDQLNEEIEQICTEKYKLVTEKLRRAAVRAVLYLFLTKMLFALILEIPADRFLEGEIRYVPLAINTVLPPGLMFFIALLISSPGKDNTQRIQAKIKSIISSEPENDQKITISAKPGVSRSVLTFIFSIIYGLTFFLIFGFFVWGLTRLGFNFVSQLIFLFFLTVVSFFAYRIKQIPKEYRYNEKESAVRPVLDFLLLPILAVGKRLSEEIGRINVITFIFDFILEAPFKAVFEVVEEWIGFLRSKREEIA